MGARPAPGGGVGVMQRIALVDDDGDNRRVIASVLGDAFEILEFEDGFAALDGLARAEPDLVFMGIALPGLDGRDVLRHLRRDPKMARLPIVALTTDATTTDREQYRELGFDACVDKPVGEGAALLELVRGLLSGPAQAPASVDVGGVPVELRRSFVQSLPVPLVEIGQAIDGMQAGREGAEQAARKVAHRLKGTGTSFGFPEMTTAGARVGECADSRLELTVAMLELLGTVGRSIVEGHGLGARTVLVVGQDLMRSTGMVRPFDALGLTVLETSTLEQARAWLAEHAPNIVLLDAVLPDGEGQELVEVAAVDPRRAVIVVSALTSSETKRAYFAAGADFFIDKPVEPTLLCTMMVRAMQKSGSTA